MIDPAEQVHLTGLRLSGRRVVVVGGGALAARRLPALLSAGARVHLVAPAVSPTVRTILEAAGGALAERAYRPGDLDGAWYALALTDDPAVNAAVVAEAETTRVFCVRGDDAVGGTAVTPATASVGPVRVGVLGGGDPGRAAAVRDAVLELVESGSVDLSARRPPSTAADARLPGVAVVGGGPGAEDLITVRGRRLLARADVVVIDRLAPLGLLADLRPDVEIIDAGKVPRGPAMAQEVINQLLVERARSGRFVVRLKGGDPFVFGRGYEEVQACAAAGIPVTVVPGLSSAGAVPALAGIPLTHRGVAHDVVIASGHLPPDHPSSLVDWSALARSAGTLVLLMAVENLPAIAATLIANGRPGTTPAALVQDGSLASERIVRADLAGIAESAARSGVRAPAVVVIGGVAALGSSAP